MTVTGWDNGLSQDYNKKLGQWFANRLGAREELRRTLKEIKMDKIQLTQVLEALNTCYEFKHGGQTFKEYSEDSVANAIAILIKELEKPDETPFAYRKWSSKWHEWEYSQLCTNGSEPLYLRPQSCECCKKEPTFSASLPAPNKPEPRMP